MARREVICVGFLTGKCKRKTCPHGMFHVYKPMLCGCVTCACWQKHGDLIDCVTLSVERMNQIMPAIMLADCPAYGYELILDMVDCNPDTFNRVGIRPYLTGLCVRTGVTAENLEWYDYEDEDMTQEELNAVEDHIFGTSAVQFITTSSIVIHTLPRLKRMFLNLFSCSKFEVKEIAEYSQEHFEGRISQKLFIPRGVHLKLEE